MSDLECPFDMVCWSPSELEADNRRRTCIRKAFYNDTYEFGWISQYRDDSDNIKANGQICRSGFAYRFYDTVAGAYTNKAICSAVKGIYSDKGDAGVSNACTAVGSGSTCDYFFSDFAANTYMSGACKCALDASMGFCPVFN